MQDPMSEIGLIDQLSLLLGLHEESHVIVVSTTNYSTDVHMFTFQKRLKDGAFFLSEEHVVHMPDSLLVPHMPDIHHQAAKLQNRYLHIFRKGGQNYWIRLVIQLLTIGCAENVFYSYVLLYKIMKFLTNM